MLLITLIFRHKTTALSLNSIYDDLTLGKVHVLTHPTHPSYVWNIRKPIFLNEYWIDRLLFLRIHYAGFRFYFHYCRKFCFPKRQLMLDPAFVYRQFRLTTLLLTILGSYTRTYVHDLMLMEIQFHYILVQKFGNLLLTMAMWYPGE